MSFFGIRAKTWIFCVCKRSRCMVFITLWIKWNFIISFKKLFRFEADAKHSIFEYTINLIEFYNMTFYWLVDDLYLMKDQHGYNKSVKFMYSLTITLHFKIVSLMRPFASTTQLYTYFISSQTNYYCLYKILKPCSLNRII